MKYRQQLRRCSVPSLLQRTHTLSIIESGVPVDVPHFVCEATIGSMRPDLDAFAGADVFLLHPFSHCDLQNNKKSPAQKNFLHISSTAVHRIFAMNGYCRARLRNSLPSASISCPGARHAYNVTIMTHTSASFSGIVILDVLKANAGR